MGSQEWWPTSEYSVFLAVVIHLGLYGKHALPCVACHCDFAHLEFMRTFTQMLSFHPQSINCLVLWVKLAVAEASLHELCMTSFVRAILPPSTTFKAVTDHHHYSSFEEIVFETGVSLCRCFLRFTVMVGEGYFVSMYGHGPCECSEYGSQKRTLDPFELESLRVGGPQVVCMSSQYT